MWKVYIRKIVTDPKYGNRTVEIEQCEGNREYCEKYVAEHPGTYIAWYCVSAETASWPSPGTALPGLMMAGQRRTGHRPERSHI